MDIQKRLTWVDTKRNKGNQLYREKKINEAVSAYTKCTRVIEQGKLIGTLLRLYR